MLILYPEILVNVFIILSSFPMDCLRVFYVQAYLRNIADSVPDGHNKMIITIKKVTCTCFEFSVNKNLCNILSCSLLSVQ